MINLENNSQKFAGVKNELKDKIIYVIELYNKLLEKLDEDFKSYVRFQDFYDINITAKENIELFNSIHEDEELLIYYIKYIVERLLDDVFFALSDCEFCMSEYLEVIDDQNIFDEAQTSLEYALKLIEEKEKSVPQIDFLNENNPYKIMFTKMASEDITELPKNILKIFIRKLYNPLSTDLVIKLSENTEHTNEVFGTHYARIQFADDYRIAYFREKGVTVIVGVTLKNGKNSDYTRLDAAARKNGEILSQIDDFKNGIFTKEHLETIAYIEKMFSKQNIKS